MLIDLRTKSRPRRMPGALVLVFLLVGCAASAPSPSPTPVTHAITGTFVLQQKEAVLRFPAACKGTGGYSDITDGLGVVVKDDKGAVVGTGPLESVPVHDVNTTEALADSQRCSYTFAVGSLPDAPFYSVEVGHRGAITYSRADLEAAGWKVSTKLGE